MGLSFNLGRLSPSLFTDSSLNVGIGAAPSGSYKLEVTGTAKVSSTLLVSGAASFDSSITLTGNGTQANNTITKLSNGYMYVDGNTNGLILENNNSSSTRIRLEAADNMQFQTASTERMRITSGGKVNIGTESAPNSTAFNVAGADTSNDLGKFYLNATSSLDKALLRLEKFQNNSTTSQVFVNFTINAQATANGSITANGASQVTFTAWSDRRLKENIIELSPQLENILALKPSEFDYKDGSGHQIGFIAQEMQEVYPDAVGENGQGFLTVAGWNKTEAILVKAIQEQNQIIQELNERLNKAGL